MEKYLYHANAMYRCGSTDEIIRVFINVSENKNRAVELCNDYAKKKERKGIIKTWIYSEEKGKNIWEKSYTKPMQYTPAKKQTRQLKN